MGEESIKALVLKVESMNSKLLEFMNNLQPTLTQQMANLSLNSSPFNPKGPSRLQCLKSKTMHHKQKGIAGTSAIEEADEEPETSQSSKAQPSNTHTQSTRLPSIELPRFQSDLDKFAGQFARWLPVTCLGRIDEQAKIDWVVMATTGKYQEILHKIIKEKLSCNSFCKSSKSYSQW